MTTRTLPLKRLADIRFSSVDKHSVVGERPVRLCNYVDVCKNNEITEDLVFMVGTATSDEIGRFGLQAGDVLITKDSETPDEIGVPAFVPKALDGVVCGYHLAIVRATSDLIDSRYLYWALAADSTRRQFSERAMGITRFGLRHAEVGAVRLPFPPAGEQRAIARFLDHETARIDRVMELKRRVSRLLKIRRAALLSETLAQGLPSDAAFDATALKAASGAPVMRLKHVAAGLTAGGTPSTENARFWGDADDRGIPWVTIGDMVDAGTTVVTARRVSAEGLAAYRLRIGTPGTILLAMYASIGKLSTLGIPACWNQAILGITPREEIIQPAYLSHWLELMRPVLVGMARSNTQDNLNAEQVGNLPVPVPALRKQTDMIAELAEKLRRLDHLGKTIEDHLLLLEERRHVLITAAVAGEIGIPDRDPAASVP
jgi:type I restriction enzyme S subunit